MKKCYVLEYKKLIDYEEGLEIQKRAFDFVKENDIDGIILLLQHKPVFTTGSSGGNENMLVSKELLDEMGINIYQSSRGGNITFHGPGQMVAYPILDLSKFKKDLHWYLRQLEEVIIKAIETYGIEAGRKPKYTGVWIGNRKIAAIGVHVRKWITMHGFAFNITVNKDHFNLINPCGITEFGIASLDDYIKEIDYPEVLRIIKEKLEEVFDIKLIDSNIELL